MLQDESQIRKKGDAALCPAAFQHAAADYFSYGGMGKITEFPGTREHPLIRGVPAETVATGRYLENQHV